jgi:hypothetical protein
MRGCSPSFSTSTPQAAFRFDDMAHFGSALPRQFRAVHRFAGFVSDQKIGQQRIVQAGCRRGW